MSAFTRLAVRIPTPQAAEFIERSSKTIEPGYFWYVTICWGQDYSRA